MDPTTDDRDDFDSIIPLHGIAVPEPAPEKPAPPPRDEVVFRFPAADDYEIPNLEFQPRLRRSA